MQAAYENLAWPTTCVGGIVKPLERPCQSPDDHCGGSRGSDMLQLPPTTPEAPPGGALGLPPL